MRTIGTMMAVVGLALLGLAGVGVLSTILAGKGGGAGAFVALFIWFPGAVLLGLGCLLRLAFKAHPEDREPMPPPRTEPFQP